MTRLIPAIASALILSVSLPIVAAAEQTRSLTLDDRDRYDTPAAKGDSRAQTALGLRFAAHKTPESDITAFDWFRRAAEQGDAEAQLLISGLYATGRGTAKDYVAAYKWAYLSGLRATETEIIVNASNMIGVLNRQMTEAEIDRARAEAVAWKATPEIVQTAATQPVTFQTASQSAPVKVELPAPVTSEAAPAPTGNPEPAKLVSAPAAPAQAAAAPVVEAPAAESLAKAEDAVQARTDGQANGSPAAAPKAAAADKKAGRSNTKRTAAKSKPRARNGQHVRYEDMVGTALSYARAYGIHLGGWQY